MLPRKQLGRLDDAMETLGQGRVERHLAQVMQQPANKGFGRID